MNVLLILVVIFISASLVVYSILHTSAGAWERYSQHFTNTADDQLQKMFVFADARKLLFIFIGALLLVPILLVWLGQSPVLIAAVVACIIIAPKMIMKRLANNRRDAINTALPDALQQISGAMRAGSTFTTAIQAMVAEQTGPISQEFSLMLREQRLGSRLEEALENLGERVQTEEMDLVISAALIAQDVGGNLSEILHRLSDTIRRKLEMEGKIKALTAQGVLQGRVVTMLPFMVLAALLFIEPEATRAIYTGLLGWIFLFVILVLQLVGGAMIRKIVNIEI
ncbi:MAG: type II secretion system F family protein [Granulosicoccaceae bacterium]